MEVSSGPRRIRFQEAQLTGKYMSKFVILVTSSAKLNRELEGDQKHTQSI